MTGSGDLTIRQQYNATVVRIETENLMGVVDVNRIEAQISALIDSGAHKVVLDLKHVKFICSAALGMVMALHKKLKSLNGQLVLSHTESIDSLLKISRADKILKIAPDPKTALTMIET